MTNEINKGTPLNMYSLINYSDNAIISKQILKNTAGNITLFSFDKGQGLSEHTAPFDAFIQIIEGTVEVRIGGKPQILKQGDSIIMPANITHALQAIEKFKMLLTMIKAANNE